MKQETRKKSTANGIDYLADKSTPETSAEERLVKNRRSVYRIFRHNVIFFLTTVGGSYFCTSMAIVDGVKLPKTSQSRSTPTSTSANPIVQAPPQYGTSFSDNEQHLQCPFFNHRVPAQNQNDLRNCTWHKQLSCCRQPELESLFRPIKPLQNASPACVIQLNLLICWVCDPFQSNYYSPQQQLLTLCENFCEEIHDACSSALLKGKPLGVSYRTGRDFCVSRGFDVSNESSKCYRYDVEKLAASDDQIMRQFALATLSLQGGVSVEGNYTANDTATDGTALDRVPHTWTMSAMLLLISIRFLL